MVWKIFRQSRQLLADFLEAEEIRRRSSANNKWLKFLGRLELNPGTRLSERALLKMAVRF